jgi:hypothetical protein
MVRGVGRAETASGVWACVGAGYLKGLLLIFLCGSGRDVGEAAVRAAARWEER